MQWNKVASLTLTPFLWAFYYYKRRNPQTRILEDNEWDAWGNITAADDADNGDDDQHHYHHDHEDHDDHEYDGVHDGDNAYDNGDSANDNGDSAYDNGDRSYDNGDDHDNDDDIENDNVEVDTVLQNRIIRSNVHSHIKAYGWEYDSAFPD